MIFSPSLGSRPAESRPYINTTMTTTKPRLNEKTGFGPSWDRDSSWPSSRRGGVVARGPIRQVSAPSTEAAFDEADMRPGSSTALGASRRMPMRAVSRSAIPMTTFDATLVNPWASDTGVTTTS